MTQYEIIRRQLCAVGIGGALAKRASVYEHLGRDVVASFENPPQSFFDEVFSDLAERDPPIEDLVGFLARHLTRFEEPFAAASREQAQ